MAEIDGGLTFQTQSKLPSRLPAVMGGRRIEWSYSEIVNPTKWINGIGAQDSMRTSAKYYWALTAEAAGYKIEGTQREKLTFMWTDANGVWTEVPGVGPPTVYKFTISGTVVPKR